MPNTLTREQQLVVLEATQNVVDLFESCFVRGAGVPSPEARRNLAQAIDGLNAILPKVRAQLMGEPPTKRSH